MDGYSVTDIAEGNIRQAADFDLSVLAASIPIQTPKLRFWLNGIPRFSLPARPRVASSLLDGRGGFI
jgi:hypothetical protein